AGGLIFWRAFQLRAFYFVVARLDACRSAIHCRTVSARFRLAMFCWTACLVHSSRSCLRNARALIAGGVVETDCAVCAIGVSQTKRSMAREIGKNISEYRIIYLH